MKIVQQIIIIMKKMKIIIKYKKLLILMINKIQKRSLICLILSKNFILLSDFVKNSNKRNIFNNI